MAQVLSVFVSVLSCTKKTWTEHRQKSWHIRGFGGVKIGWLYYENKSVKG
jgi:hypothetical protein